VLNINPEAFWFYINTCYFPKAMYEIMAKKEINPNADKDFVDQLDLANEHNFPKFLKSIKLSPFRHITELTLNFIHPISVIAGTNRSGKSTVLMALACSHFDFKKRTFQGATTRRVNPQLTQTNTYEYINGKIVLVQQLRCEQAFPNSEKMDCSLYVLEDGELIFKKRIKGAE
jgi:hypothetical protein